MQASTASAMPGPAALSLDGIPGIVGQALEQAQRTTATHRKNVAILHKLLLTSCNIVEKLENGKGTRLVGEKAFCDAVKASINKIVVVKKGVQQADRCIKFVCAFVAYASEQGQHASGIFVAVYTTLSLSGKPSEGQ